MCSSGDADESDPKIYTCPVPLKGQYVTIQRTYLDAQNVLYINELEVDVVKFWFKNLIKFIFKLCARHTCFKSLTHITIKKVYKDASFWYIVCVCSLCEVSLLVGEKRFLHVVTSVRTGAHVRTVPSMFMYCTLYTAVGLASLSNLPLTLPSFRHQVDWWRQFLHPHFT